MKVLYATLSAAALTLSLAGTAGAVDIQNPSSADYVEYNTLTIMENGQTKEIHLMNGQVLYDVCKACTIRLENGQEIQASEFDMVETNGSSLKVIKFPRRS
jgi:hypothetical protein